MNGFYQFAETSPTECKLSEAAKESPGKSLDYGELDKPIATKSDETSEKETFADSVDSLGNESASLDDMPQTVGDDSGKAYMENGKLLPNSTYVLNENTYQTDDKRRIICCESTPQLMPENTRDNKAQTSAGGEDRKSGDQGGHIVGRDMGGDAGSGNIVAMDSRINQSDYKRMENDIKKELEDRKVVTTKTEFKYPESSERPDKVTTTVTSDGKDTVYTFDNNLDGSLIDKLKETSSKNDIEVVEKTLDAKSGTISSTKEAYDSEGKLKGTIVTITYVDDDGNNQRLRLKIDHNGGDSQ